MAKRCLGASPLLSPPFLERMEWERPMFLWKFALDLCVPCRYGTWVDIAHAVVVTYIFTAVSMVSGFACKVEGECRGNNTAVLQLQIVLSTRQWQV